MTDNPNGLIFHETSNGLLLNGDATEATIVRRQEIPDSFWEQAAQLKHVQDRAPAGEFLCAATIPEVVVEKWYAEGFNIFDQNVTLKEIMARLRAEDMGKLITTSRTL